MPHILVARKIADAGIALLRAQAGLTVEVLEDYAEAQFSAALSKADGVILYFQPLKAAHIAAAPRLLIVSRHGVGVDSVDVAALNQRAIALTITPGANAVAVAEHAVALLLSVARRVIPFDRDVRSGAWHANLSPPMFELCAKRALIVGAGRIGLATARRLQAFDMRIDLYDPVLPADIDADLGQGMSRAADLHEALAQADVVSLHLPLTAQTRRAIDPRRMKRGAILVNTARGGTVDQDALVEALASGHLLGAGLDVHGVEPVEAGYPLARFDNVVLSPHAAALTDGGLRRMALEAAQNVIDYFAGKSLSGSMVNSKGAVA